MSDDSVDHFGGSSQPQAARATNGGQQTPKEINYAYPQGPKEQFHQGPGLGGGTNYGNSVNQGRH